MISYKLAKKLKDARFPQATGGFYYWNRECDCNKGQLITPFYDEKVITHTIKIPTLSELIEACGDRFHSLERLIKIDTGEFTCWIANSSDVRYGDVFDETPEEAVANLWLVLK